MCLFDKNEATVRKILYGTQSIRHSRISPMRRWSFSAWPALDSRTQVNVLFSYSVGRGTGYLGKLDQKPSNPLRPNQRPTVSALY